MSMAPAQASLINIQYLRALAVLMVVWLHARDHFQSVRQQFPSEFGTGGVDLFFVISGFIMVYTTQGKNIAPWRFMVRRLERIAPLYWLATLAVAAVALVAPSLLKSTVLSGPHIAASLAFVPMLSPAFAGTYWPLVIPGWTLNYEMAFYAVFALTLLARGAWRLLALGTVLTGTFLAGLVLNWKGVLGFYSDSIILIFLLGSLIGYLHISAKLQQSNGRGAFLVLSGISLWLLLQGFEIGHRAVRAGLPAALIVMGACLTPALQGRWLRWLARLGDASFSIYLSHIFFLALLRNIIQRSGFSPDSAASGWAYMLLSLALCGVGGLLVYQFIERFLARTIVAWKG